jgi:hypothetical protein
VLQRDLNFQAPPRPTITPHKQKRSSPPMRPEKVSPMPENWLLIGATAKPSQFGEMAERPPTAPQKSVKSRPVFPGEAVGDAMHKNCTTGAEFWHFGAGKLPRQPHGYGSSGRRKRDKPEQGDISSQRDLTLDAKPVPAFAGHTIRQTWHIDCPYLT